MSNYAVITWCKELYNDQMFNIFSTFNRDHLLNPYYEMKLEFENKGHCIHTIDKYTDYSDIDFFLFFTLNWQYYKKIVKIGKDNRMVYCTAEPPSVYRYNTPKGYKLLKRIFPYILTWNNDWVDNKYIFKRNLPYFFSDNRGNIPFVERKLVTLISSNKSSVFPGELYSERVRLIDFFEQEHPEAFDFYGFGWDFDSHICYQGTIADKADIYHKYRFAICLENIEGYNGYVTEKILDCITCGIVPIYAGAPNIDEYIPKECYISLRDFDSYEALYSFLCEITEEKYSCYLQSAENYLQSSLNDDFSGKRYADYILEATARVKKRYKSSYFFYKMFNYIYYRK